MDYTKANLLKYLANECEDFLRAGYDSTAKQWTNESSKEGFWSSMALIGILRTRIDDDDFIPFTKDELKDPIKATLDLIPD